MAVTKIFKAAIIAGGMLASSAYASITFVEGDTPGSLTNVLLDRGSSNPVTGSTQPNQGGFGIEVTSTGSIEASASGQADITGDFSDVTITPADAEDAFDIFQFALQLSEFGDITVTATDQFGTDFDQTFADIDPGNQNSRFTLLTDAAQVITSVTVTSTVGINAFRQIRIDDATNPPGGGTGGEVPEPAALGLFGLGLLGLATLRRRKA